MDFATAIATATAHGWSDDSRWARSALSHQISVERDGFLASVQVHRTGKVAWNVLSAEGTGHAQRGTAANVDAALRACDEAILAATGALF